MSGDPSAAGGPAMNIRQQLRSISSVSWLKEPGAG